MASQAERDCSTEVQNDEGTKMQGLQEGGWVPDPGQLLHSPQPLCTLAYCPLFLYLDVGVISEPSGSAGH